MPHDGPAGATDRPPADQPYRTARPDSTTATATERPEQTIIERTDTVNPAIDTSPDDPALGGTAGEEAPVRDAAAGDAAARSATAAATAVDLADADPADADTAADPARPAPSDAPVSGGGRRRRPPALVGVITVLHVALLITYSFVYTTWTGYDEAQHVDMVYGLQHGAGWPGPGEKMIAIGVAATSDDFDRGRYQDMFQSGGKRRGSEPFAEIAPTPRGERASFDELGGPTPIDDGRLSNQMIQHPPLIYAVGAGLLTVLPGSENWAYDQQVYVLRLLNILVLAPLPLLMWAAARRFGLAEPPAVAVAALPLAIPGFTRVGATFNNDGILVLAVGVLTVSLVGVLRGDFRKRTAVWIGGWFGVALMTKAFAIPMPLMIGAAYLIGWARLRRPREPATADARAADTGAAATEEHAAGRDARLPWRPALLAIGLGLALAGWWWVRNVVRYDSVQPNGWDTHPPRREPLLLPDSFLTWFSYFFRTMISRFWGGLGMFEPPQLSPIAIVTATVVVVALCGMAFVGALRGPRGDRGPIVDRLLAAAAFVTLLMPIGFAYFSVGQRSWEEYERYTRGIAVQGRYLYLGLVGLGVVVAVGLGRLLGNRARWAPTMVLGGVLVMQAVALLAVCSYYWLPRQVAFTPARIPDVVSAIARWAPFPVGVTVAVFAVTAVVALVAVIATVADATRRAGPGHAA